jgi:hypothetical protein
MGLINITPVQDGTSPQASQVNNPLNTIVNEFNGNIDNNNIATNANIAGTKFADASIPGSKLGAPYAPQGYVQNGKIERTVASNNITVAIKTLAGTDPSATDPVFVRIGNTVRSVTSALSVTRNAGTNWFNSGAAEHATQDIDYFVYLGYNATDGVTVGFARIPYGRVYSDFSATTTNDKYCAISTITNASASDEYEVVGRINATLSATAAFNWSIPATSIVISRPIYETRELAYVPTQTGYSAVPAGGQYLYKRVGRSVSLSFRETNAGTSNTTGLTLSLPVSAKSTSYVYQMIFGVNNGALSSCSAIVDGAASATVVTLWVGATLGAWTASGTKRTVGANLTYEAA